MSVYNKQRGVGLIEVMIAALILAISVSGTVILMSDWFQGMNDASNRNDALVRIGSVMEAGRYDPNASEITSRANALVMASPRVTYTVDNISVTTGTGSDAFSAKVSWTDPYLDGSDQGRAFNLSSAAPHDAAFQPLSSLFVASVTQYVVTVSQGVGTTLSPSSNQTVDDGSTVAFTGIAIANATYFETLVLTTTCGNDSSYSSGAGTYTTAAISANCSVSSSASLIDTDGDTVPDICDDAVATATYSIDCSQYTSLIPVAADDAASTNEDTSVDIAVLSNDTYVDAGDLAVNLGSASNGTVSLVGNTVRFTPTANFSGTGSFTYTVTASARTSSAATVTVSVSAVNDGPTANAGSDQTVASGASFTLSGSGTDPEGDSLTYTWSQTAGSSVASFNTTQASPSVTAPTLLSSDSAMTLTFSLSVSDGAASASDTVNITVNPPAPTNNAPVLAAIGNQSSDVGATVSLTTGASDADGDSLTFSASGLPSGLAIDSSTGAITGTLSASANTYSVTVSVTDGTDSDSETFNWTVVQPNRAPVMGAIGNQTDDENATVSLSTGATDADGDTLTYTASGLPGGLSINSSTGQITGTISGSAGTYSVTVTASDGSLSDSESFTWTVNAVVSTWTATINITGITGQGNGKFSVSVPGCSPSSKGNNTAAFSCTATISDASWSPSVTINPAQSYCTSSSSKSSSDYTPSVTLSAATPTVSISVTFVNNRTNNCSAPAVTYP